MFHTINTARLRCNITNKLQLLRTSSNPLSVSTAAAITVRQFSYPTNNNTNKNNNKSKTKSTTTATATVNKSNSSKSSNNTDKSSNKSRLPINTNTANLPYEIPIYSYNGKLTILFDSFNIPYLTVNKPEQGKSATEFGLNLYKLINEYDSQYRIAAASNIANTANRANNAQYMSIHNYPEVRPSFNQLNSYITQYINTVKFNNSLLFALTIGELELLLLGLIKSNQFRSGTNLINILYQSSADTANVNTVNMDRYNQSFRIQQLIFYITLKSTNNPKRTELALKQLFNIVLTQSNNQSQQSELIELQQCFIYYLKHIPIVDLLNQFIQFRLLIKSLTNNTNNSSSNNNNNTNKLFLNNNIYSLLCMRLRSLSSVQLIIHYSTLDSIELTITDYNLLLNLYSSKYQFDAVLALYNYMKNQSILTDRVLESNNITYSILIKTAGIMQNLELFNTILTEIQQKSNNNNTKLINDPYIICALLTAYSNLQLFDKVIELYNTISINCSILYNNVEFLEIITKLARDNNQLKFARTVSDRYLQLIKSTIPIHEWNLMAEKTGIKPGNTTTTIANNPAIINTSSNKCAYSASDLSYIISGFYNSGDYRSVLILITYTREYYQQLEPKLYRCLLEFYLNSNRFDRIIELVREIYSYHYPIHTTPFLLLIESFLLYTSNTKYSTLAVELLNQIINSKEKHNNLLECVPANNNNNTNNNTSNNNLIWNNHSNRYNLNLEYLPIDSAVDTVKLLLIIIKQMIQPNLLLSESNRIKIQFNTIGSNNHNLINLNNINNNDDSTTGTEKPIKYLLDYIQYAIKSSPNTNRAIYFNVGLQWRAELLLKSIEKQLKLTNMKLVPIVSTTNNNHSNELSTAALVELEFPAYELALPIKSILEWINRAIETEKSFQFADKQQQIQKSSNSTSTVSAVAR